MKHALEDRWKSLRQQLKERPPLYQADEAAAMIFKSVTQDKKREYLLLLLL